MKVVYKKIFLRDIKKVKAAKTKELIAAVIEQCKAARIISDISHCEPLTNRGKYFKIKRGSYRFGVKINDGTVTMMAVGTRQNFYKNFPPK